MHKLDGFTLLGPKHAVIPSKQDFISLLENFAPCFVQNLNAEETTSLPKSFSVASLYNFLLSTG